MAVSLVSTGIQFPDSTTQTTAGAPTSNTQTFTSSGTWTKPSGFASTSRVLIQIWGGGGGGGRNATYGGGGGGGGGFNQVWRTLSELGSTESVTVGAGGAAGVSCPGNGGGGGVSFVGTSNTSNLAAFGGGGGGYSGPAGAGGGWMSQGSSQATGTYGPGGGPPVIIVGTPRADGYGGPSNAGTYLNIRGWSTYAAAPEGSVSRSTCNGLFYPGKWHGGAGGQSRNNQITIGTWSEFAGGGGGGAGYTGQPVCGGRSRFTSTTGGAGGLGCGNASAGQQPAGGGGGASNGSAGAGGAGKVVITVFG